MKYVKTDIGSYSTFFSTFSASTPISVVMQFVNEVFLLYCFILCKAK